MLTEITFDELLAEFDPSVHENLRTAYARPTVTALVVFENQQFDSSACGQKTAMVVGPLHTYTSVTECEGRHLNDLPSRRQYAVRYCKKPETPKDDA